MGALAMKLCWFTGYLDIVRVRRRRQRLIHSIMRLTQAEQCAFARGEIPRRPEAIGPLGQLQSKRSGRLFDGDLAFDKEIADPVVRRATSVAYRASVMRLVSVVAHEIRDQLGL